MKVILDFTIIPIGIGVSLSKYVAECENILAASNIKYQLHPNGTAIEGQWEDVFNAIQQCHQRLHEMGVPRISSSIRVGTRIDRDQSLVDKVESVLSKLDQEES